MHNIISEQTLAYAESAFSTETTFSKILKNEPSVIFRIVSEIKMGYEFWKKSSATEGAEVTKEKHVFRPEDKSKAIKLKEPHDDNIAPFLFFCAYLPAKKVLQIITVQQRAIFEDILATYRKFQPENVYDFATCRVQKNIINGQNRYAFDLITTMDKNFTTQVARSDLPEECIELMKIMPFNLDNIYLKQDAFCAI